MLIVDDQWLRVNDESDENGDPLVAKFGRMVRTQGGMVIGRIVMGTGRFAAHRWKYGKFIELGDYGSIEEAYQALEAYQT